MLADDNVGFRFTNNGVDLVLCLGLLPGTIPSRFHGIKKRLSAIWRSTQLILNDDSTMSKEAEVSRMMIERETEAEVILVETNSSQLIDALRAQSFRRFDEPHFTLCGKIFPLFYVPLVLFFVFLFGFLACLLYANVCDDVVVMSSEIDSLPASSKRFKILPHDVTHQNPSTSQNVGVNERVDCLPDAKSSDQAEKQCLSRGCSWSPATEPPSPHNLVPWCFFTPNRTFYYVHKSNSSRDKLDLLLTLASPEDPKTQYLPDVVKNLKVELINHRKNIARVRITDFDNPRFEVPNLKYPDPPENNEAPNYSFEVGNFSLVIRRNSDGVVVFDTRLAPLIFANQFLQLTTALSGNKVFGLGEHRTGAALWDINWTRAAFWAADQAPKEDRNLYGVHPVLMSFGSSEGNPQASGIFLLNSNAMETVLQPYPAVTFRTIGGVLDFFVYSGPTPLDVMQAHWSVVGRPAAPPHWALGFHLCRWGYKTDKDLEQQIGNMRTGLFPYSTQWNDIDYMHEKLDFTVDQQRYMNLSSIVKSLHSKGQRYVMILDPGISNIQPEGDYPPFDDGIALDVFIKDFKGDPIVGVVWPGNTVFPDFTSLNANLWWAKNLQVLQDKIHFDGVWIDMNEPSNFVHGSTTGCNKRSKLDFPYYIPSAIWGSTFRIFTKTLCPSAQQKLGTHFDVHSMYGLFEMRATHYAMKSIKPSDRPLIISRSTFPFSGQYGGHWLGDNSPTWYDLKSSITGVLNFNFFGIPLVGADICGFNGNTQPELCVRWTQVGAFYPFMRNHNTVGANPQDPASFKTPEVRNALREALQLRYKNLPYLYSKMLEATLSGTVPVRSMFMNYFDDNQTWDLSDQFMWGDEVMITPVLEKDKSSVNAFFPVGTWYDWVSNKTVRIAPPSGRFLSDLPAPLNHIPVWIRGGKTIVQRIPDFENNLPLEGKLRIIIALDENQVSHGTLLWDDEGDSANSVEPPSSLPQPPAYNASSTSLDLVTSPSIPSWHVRVNFRFDDGVLSSSPSYHWGGVHSQKSQRKAKEFLSKRLKVEEIVILGIRGGGGGGVGGGENSSFSFSLEKEVKKNNNEEEERGEKRKSLIWEKYDKIGILIRVGGQLDLTAKFLIFADHSTDNL